MELTWLMRLRIAAAGAVGAVLIGLLGWAMVSPCEPGSVVQATSIGSTGALIMVLIAVVCGFIGYFVSWPYGREVGILAVPFGLGVWGLRTASMASLMQLNPLPEQRQAIFAALRWEPIFWLALVAAGFAGVLIAQQLAPSGKVKPKPEDDKPNTNKYLHAAIAIVGSVVLAQFCISILVADVTMPDNQVKSVVGQPSHGQIVFGVIASFAAAAFVVKKFLDVNYVIPAISSGLVTIVMTVVYVKPQVLEYMAGRWAGAFFSNASAAVLPVQMVAFGALGAVAGYWMAVRFDWWRKHENE